MCWKKITTNLEFYIQQNYSSKGEIETFSDGQNLKKLSPIDLIWIKFSNKFIRRKENYMSDIHNKVEVLEKNDNKTAIFLINWSNKTLSFSLSIRGQTEWKPQSQKSN